jgi:hypothetical protein
LYCRIYEKWQERNDLIDETEESQSGFVIGNQGKFNLESFEEQKREKKKHGQLTKT